MINKEGGEIMKRKGLMFLNIILWLCIINSFSVLAGDVPESALLNADYCFIGEVQSIEDSFTIIRIHEVVFGHYSEDTIKLPDLKYTVAIGKTSLPKVGDYCAVVVKKSSDGYVVYSELAAESDSLDRETLKLKSTQEFVVRMNEYINNGHYSNQTIEEINIRINESKGFVTAAPSTPINNETANIVEETVENSSNDTDQNSETVLTALCVWLWLLCFC